MKNILCSAALSVVLFASNAEAFCGFYVSGAGQALYNNATQVALMREGTRTVLSMQNNYQGPPEDFAMVVPVPVVLQEANVKTLPKEIFQKLDQLASPRLVQYWEQDPCYQPRYEVMGAVPSAPMPAGAMRAMEKADKDYGVKIEAKFTVGEYNIVILSAKDGLGLESWLKDNRYKIPEGAAPLFRPYIQQGMKFFVAKVDVKKVKFEGNQAMLSPLRFHYDSDTFNLPIRLGLINAKDKQDLIVHILARDQRYETANYPNVTIPTNIDLKEEAQSQFPAFYASLFDLTLEKTPKAVVTEYAWQSNSCDPCPIPPLDDSNLMTLGLDVLDGADMKQVEPQIEVKNLDALSAQDRRLVEQTLQSLKVNLQAQRQNRRFNRGGFTLTRLHARYDKNTLGEDLVFKAAPPIVGGREFMQKGNELETGARPDNYTNNFQGRYAIRHPWTGPIACQNPRRGIWGGPPNGGTPGPIAAKDLAFAPRSPETAKKLVESAVAELSLKGEKPHAGIPRNLGAKAPSGKKDDDNNKDLKEKLKQWTK